MLKTSLTIIIVAVLSWLGFACLKPTEKAPPSTSFYYWKTSLQFDKNDKALADSLGMKKLYVRFFDVDWSPTYDMPVPLGVLSMDGPESISYDWLYDHNSKHIGDYQTVPVVYLTNRVFQKDFNPDSLAAKVSSKIQSVQDQFNIFPSWGDGHEMAEVNVDEWWALSDTLQKQFKEHIQEIQLDCDWTPSTRERYFAFIEAMKKANPGLEISCTVRLHQFRDREKAGIPPVPYATLMCYNFETPSSYDTADAIFDSKLAEGYLKNGDYPMPLEAALPLFSWGALFHESEFKGLAAGLSEQDVKDNPLFKPLEKNRYQFTKDTVFQNSYMREGDLVRLDEASPADLQEFAGRLGKIKAVKSISFFEWNPSKIKAYHVNEIFQAFSAAR